MLADGPVTSRFSITVVYMRSCLLLSFVLLISRIIASLFTGIRKYITHSVEKRSLLILQCHTFDPSAVLLSSVGRKVMFSLYSHSWDRLKCILLIHLKCFACLNL